MFITHVGSVTFGKHLIRPYWNLRCGCSNAFNRSQAQPLSSVFSRPTLPHWRLFKDAAVFVSAAPSLTEATESWAGRLYILVRVHGSVGATDTHDSPRDTGHPQRGSIEGTKRGNFIRMHTSDSAKVVIYWWRPVIVCAWCTKGHDQQLVCVYKAIVSVTLHFPHHDLATSGPD